MSLFKTIIRKKEVIISLRSDHIISHSFIKTGFTSYKKKLTDVFRSFHKNIKSTVVLKSPSRLCNAFQVFKRYFINVYVTLEIMSTLVKINGIFKMSYSTNEYYFRQS